MVDLIVILIDCFIRLVFLLLFLIILMLFVIHTIIYPYLKGIQIFVIQNSFIYSYNYNFVNIVQVILSVSHTSLLFLLITIDFYLLFFNYIFDRFLHFNNFSFVFMDCNMQISYLLIMYSNKCQEQLFLNDFDVVNQVQMFYQVYDKRLFM